VEKKCLAFADLTMQNIAKCTEGQTYQCNLNTHMYSKHPKPGPVRVLNGHLNPGHKKCPRDDHLKARRSGFRMLTVFTNFKLGVFTRQWNVRKNIDLTENLGNRLFLT
jgi:hypothetical protein